jgi:thiamine pyrophosphokinase
MEIKDITVIGGEYGDIDHLFGALFNINKLHNDQNILWIHGDQNILFPNSENVEIGVNKNFSVLPFSDLINLTISGAKWNLENEDVEFGVSKTLRNISKNNQIHISVLDGKYCLVINN